MLALADTLQTLQKLIPPVEPDDVKWGMAFPFAWSAAVSVVGYKAWRRGVARPLWPVVLAIGGGWVGAWIMTKGVTRPFPPVDAIQWLAYVGAALLLLGLVDALVRIPPVLRWLTALLASTATIWLVSANQRQSTWTGGQTALWVAIFSLAVFVLWLSVDELAKRLSGATLAFSLAALAGLSAMVIGLSGSQSLGNRSGTLGLTLVPVWVVAVWVKELSLARGAATVFVPLWAGVLLAHHLYSPEPPAGPMLILAAVPVLLWLGVFPAVARRPVWQRAAIRGAVVLVPLLVAVGMVAVPFVRSATGQSSGEADSADQYYK